MSSPMLATLGLSLAGLLASLGALWFPASGELAVVVATGFAALALIVAVRAHLKVRGAVPSGTVEALAERLSRVETRLDSAGKTPRDRAASDLDEIATDVGSLSQIVMDLAEGMTKHERALGELRKVPGATFEPARPEASAPTPSFFLPREPAEQLRSPDRSGPIVPNRAAILEALEEGRIDLHVQPVVTLPQRRPRFYETFPILQLSTGDILLPDEFVPVLDDLRLLPRLDGIVLGRAAAFARDLDRVGIGAGVSCTLSPTSLEDAAFLLTVERHVIELRGAAERLILTIPQRAWPGSAHGRAALQRMRERGVTLALDRLTHPELDSDTLGSAGIAYVKLPWTRLMEDPQTGAPAGPFASLPVRLMGSAVQLVAEGVEGAEVVPELIELGVRFAQGFAFALPCPADAVTEPQRGQASDELLRTPGPGTDPPAPAAKPMSLRDVIRRAG